MRILCVAFLFMLGYGKVHAAASDYSLFLIPQPKKIEFRGNTFSFNQSFSIRSDNTDSFYARQLTKAISVKFKTAPSAKALHQIQLKADTAFDRIIQQENLTLPFDIGNEGYIISITPDKMLVAAKQDAGVFYGVQTLIQLINSNSTTGSIPCMVIYDKPDMAIRGWQDDISRGPIPTLGFLKEEIRRMASFKLNTFTLYTEHVFKLKKHPLIAPRDGISEKEIKELSAFARQYHVDLIGNFQSFGHFKKILDVPGYQSLAENENTLSPAKEESYKFLSDVYSEIAPAYDSKYFHINCDEVSLGSGACARMIDTMGVEGVYAYHINRIDELLKPYHKHIIMWGDIAVHHPKIIAQLPKDMVIVSWGYGPMESMDEDILPFVKSGFEFIVAPGVSCWSRIYPDINRASINIYNYLRDGYKNKALGFINTTWDDSGQNFFNNNWYSLIWGAECGWSAPTNESVEKSEILRKERVASFNRSCNKVYFNTDKDITSLLLAVSDLRNGPVKNCLSDGSLWDALLPDYSIIPANYRSDNLNLIKRIDSLLSEANKLQVHLGPRASEFPYLTFALRQARLVVNKNLLGIKLKEYVQSDSTKDISYFRKDFDRLNDTVLALKSTYSKLWLMENRKWWLDTVLSYYNSFGAHLNDLKGVCIIKASDRLINGKREIRLYSAFNNLPVYCTTDGSLPTINSTKYTQPIYSDSTIFLRARIIDQGKTYDVQSDSLIFHRAIGKLYKLNTHWNTDNTAYAARGNLGLLDGRRGSSGNFNDGRWQAYFGDDIDIELDMGGTTSLNKLTMGFAQLMRYGILYPQKIDVYTSNNGRDYRLLKTEVNTIDPNTEVRSTHDYLIPLDGATARYLRIVAKNTRVLPEWHYAKGKTGWLFADEIIVE